jgi:uncharacterized damage-inducible protein DinB
MTLEELRLLLDYHYWARDRVLEAADALTPTQFAQEQVSSFRSVRDTLVHVYAAEAAWYSRWRGESPTALLKPDEFASLAVLRSKWQALETNVRAFLEDLGPAGLTTVIEYRMLNGDARSSIFWQMLQHVVNHASYHRGQVTTLLRQLGAAPPQSMDLITFYRIRQAV